ncbi:MAG TPA: bifunctional methylenetetrahydrofolate dehydrogenase/methenyltetrahydrofolate cyclohydrolase FolD [Stellaceae bacterium]|jgi:methylenetetrahydrofolate dehydrogenase (NADP+)/methenyltetrahydrofolate cyclohydrolase|nr:bifunctional methylenetetrahydrofolate dehydrogenase/methenyltetrahydrofolate cyclohydrolase FolD [Stellaceae bacterium]
MAEAMLIDGKAVAARLQQQVADAVALLRARHRIVPGLATILVGEDAASQIYVRSKARACTAAGIASFERHLPADAGIGALLELVTALNHDDAVDGILVQFPLPAGYEGGRIVTALDPAKDVDGFHPVNVGRLWSSEPSLVPCTPQGCLILLRGTHRPLPGAEAVVLGRSTIVGRPLAALLVAADCTVTVVHSKTRDPAAICRRADVLIAAMGQPGIVTSDWVKPGATIIDVGINRISTPDQGTRLVGDVDFAAVRGVAGAITPVPGGVGPMTIACLLRNTVLAACRRRGLPDLLPDSLLPAL